MTDDIVALLRSPYTEMNVWELVDKAADEITRLRTELEAVKAERDELDALYHEGGTMETQLADAEARATEAEVELEAVKREAVEVLKPFSAHGDLYTGWPDSHVPANRYSTSAGVRSELTLGHLRAARAFVEKHGRDGNG